MEDLRLAILPPLWLIHVAVAAVWLYEGLWCKVLGRERRQVEVVEAVPYFGPLIGTLFLTSLGVVEIGLGIWVSERDRAGLVRAGADGAPRHAQRQRPLSGRATSSTTPAAWS